MNRRWKSVVKQCGIAAVAVTLALILTAATAWVKPERTDALFFAAVMISSWYGGLGAGLLATALSTIAINFVLMAPSYALSLNPGELARICVFVGVALMISSLHASQQQLGEELRRRAEQLTDADRRKDEFLATLVHELRNPIAAIRSALDVMHLSGEDEETKESMRRIAQRQLRKMTRLIDDLQDASRIGGGTLRLREEIVELGTAVHQAVEDVQPAIQSRGHELSVMLPTEPVRLIADSTRLEQVLVNLLSNAARYTDPGGKIWLTAELAGDFVTFRVRDTGIGIAPGFLPHVFGRFARERRAGREAGEGLGIGLSLVRELVELHGGRVEALSDGPGCGSEFIVSLPTKHPRGALGRGRPSAGLVPMRDVNDIPGGSALGPSRLDRELGAGTSLLRS